MKKSKSTTRKSTRELKREYRRWKHMESTNSFSRLRQPWKLLGPCMRCGHLVGWTRYADDYGPYEMSDSDDCVHGYNCMGKPLKEHIPPDPLVAESFRVLSQDWSLPFPLASLRRLSRFLRERVSLVRTQAKKFVRPLLGQQSVRKET